MRMYDCRMQIYKVLRFRDDSQYNINVLLHKVCSKSLHVVVHLVRPFGKPLGTSPRSDLSHTKLLVSFAYATNKTLDLFLVAA